MNERVTSRRWRNATAICPPELRDARGHAHASCSRAAHTSALPHTHTLTHAAPARALRSVADPERSLLDGSPSGRLRAPQQPRPLPRHSREPTRHHLRRSVVEVHEIRPAEEERVAVQHLREDVGDHELGRDEPPKRIRMLFVPILALMYHELMTYVP